MAPAVLVAGATGYIGSRIAFELGKAGILTSALVRPGASTEKREAALKKLKEANVTIIEGSLDDEEVLVKILKDFDTVVSALSGKDIVAGQLALVEASKKAGTVKRFYPSEYGGNFILSGKQGSTFNPYLRKFLEAKQIVLSALISAGIPYTLIISFAFMGYLLPHLGQLSPPSEPDTVTIFGDGTNKAFVTLEADIGKVIVETLGDPRAENAKVVIKINETTQPEIVATWERISGKKITQKNISSEEFIKADEANEGQSAVYSGLLRSIWVDGIYDREIPDAVYATELYPNLQFQTIADFFQGRV